MKAASDVWIYKLVQKIKTALTSAWGPIARTYHMGMSQEDSAALIMYLDEAVAEINARPTTASRLMTIYLDRFGGLEDVLGFSNVQMVVNIHSTSMGYAQAEFHIMNDNFTRIVKAYRHCYNGSWGPYLWEAPPVDAPSNF